MKKVKNIVIASTILITFALSGCNSSMASYKTKSMGDKEMLTENTVGNASSLANSSDFIPIIDEGNTRYFSWHTDRIRNYQSFDDLSSNAPAVVTGECIETTTVYKLHNIYTLSRICIQDVYKGDLHHGDNIWVVECGGRTTFGEYDYNCMVDEKEFENNEDRLPDDYQLVIGIDGFYPLKSGESVLLFLGDTSGFLPGVSDPLYDIIGDTDGKLYAQQDGTYRKASPSQTDHYVFDEGNLTISVEELESLE